MSPSEPRAAIGPVGAAVQLVLGWGFTLVYAAFVLTVSLVTLGRFSAALTPRLLRVWSLVMLRIMRVELVIEDRHHIVDRRPRVMLFTHASLLDAMLVTAVLPSGGVPVVKREVLKIPLVGVALWSLGFLLIDRGDNDKARRLLGRAVARIQSERLTVAIAPEGTRSATGALGPFKKGAFHLAQQSGAPVVAMLIDGAHALLPLGAWVSRPGQVRIRFVPVPSEADEPLDAFVARARDVALEGLADMRPAVAGAA